MGAQYLIGHRLLDRDGTSVGKIGQVFFDDQTDIPKWVTVRTGLFGTNENFVPLRGARTVDDDLQVAYTRDQIKDAPSFAIDEHLSVYQEDMIYRHYGLQPEVPGQRSAEEQDWQPRGKHAKRPAHADGARDAAEPGEQPTGGYAAESGQRIGVYGGQERWSGGTGKAAGDGRNG